MQFSAPFRLKPGNQSQMIGYGGKGSAVMLAITNYGPDDLVITNSDKSSDPVKTALLPGSSGFFKMEQIWASCSNSCSGTWTAFTDDEAVKTG